MCFLSNLKVIYHIEDSTYYVNEFDNILLNNVHLRKNYSPQISIDCRELL